MFRIGSEPLTLISSMGLTGYFYLYITQHKRYVPMISGCRYAHEKRSTMSWDRTHDVKKIESKRNSSPLVKWCEGVFGNWTRTPVFGCRPQRSSACDCASVPCNRNYFTLSWLNQPGSLICYTAIRLCLRCKRRRSPSRMKLKAL